jgi:hypothetical protein
MKDSKQFLFLVLAVVVGVMVHALIAPTLSSVTKLSL